MKKKMWIWAALCLLVFSVRAFGGTETSPGTEEHTLRFFYNNVCASCHEEDKFYELFNRCVTSEEKKTISYEIRTYNLFLDADEAVYEELLKEEGKDRTEYALPVLVIDGQWISGYETMEEQLHGILLEGAGPGEEQETGAAVPVEAPEKEEAFQTGEPEEMPSLSDAGDAEQALLLFTTYSCGECEEAKEFLGELQEKEEFLIEEYNVSEGDYVVVFKKLLEAYGIPQEDGKVPAVFAGGKALFGVKSIRGELPSLLAAGEAEAKTKEETPETAGAAAENKTEEMGVNAAALFSAGLLSGFNPCSISMLLMLFSILLTSHASVLKNGLAYLAGKYVVYVSLGMGIYFAAAGIDQRILSGYSGAVSLVIAVLFVTLAALNFMDFLSVRKDEYGKVRMQLPKGLRRFNHNLLKKARGAEGAFLTLLVLGLGAAVSVGEFFCTGQIYMASILYLLRSGGETARSFGALFLYVTAMSLPATVIVVLIHVTKGTGSVSEFMLRHMGAIKLLNSVLFLLYALYFLLTVSKT